MEITQLLGYGLATLLAIVLLPELLLRLLGPRGRPPLFEGIPFIGGCLKFAKVLTHTAITSVFWRQRNGGGWVGGVGREGGWEGGLGQWPWPTADWHYRTFERGCGSPGGDCSHSQQLWI